MRPIVVALSCLTTLALACQAAPQQPELSAERTPTTDSTPTAQKATPETPSRARKPTPKPEIVRKELVATDLPKVPTLASLESATLLQGEFEFHEGSDELVPRAAVGLSDGMLLVGQAYLDRRPGAPAPSRRWSGFVGLSGDASSRLGEFGAIRAAIAKPAGDGALLSGSNVTGNDTRGWFATVGGDGALEAEITLETSNTTELFDLVAGSPTQDGEFTVVGGYVDAQGWLVSLGPSNELRWQKFIGSFGQTQVRALARLDDGNLLGVGVRSDGFGESWVGIAPATGGTSPAPDDVVQAKVEIAGSDPHQMLRGIVDLGTSGYVAIGTAKRNYLQAHDQLIAVGLDRTGGVAWSRVVEGVRVTEIYGIRATSAGAQVVVGIPLDDDPNPALALALVEIPADSNAGAQAKQLSNSEGWSSAGFVDHRTQPQLLAWRASEGGIDWQTRSAP